MARHEDGLIDLERPRDSQYVYGAEGWVQLGRSAQRSMTHGQ